MGRNLVIHRSIGLGDTVFALSAATALKAEQPDTCIWYTGPSRRELWARKCLAIESGDPPPDVREVVDLNGIDVNSNEARPRLMAQALGVKDYQGGVLKFDIEPLPALANHKYALLTPFGGASVKTRSIYQDDVNALARRLLSQEPWDAIIRFERNEPWALVSDPPQMAWTDFRAEDMAWMKFRAGDCEYEMVQIALHCTVCIGVDQGMSHLAALAGRPTVIAFTHVASDARAKYHPPTVVALEPRGIPCAPCGDFAGKPACAGTRRYAACAAHYTDVVLYDAYRRLVRA